MTRCLLALGSNLGDRDKILERTCAEVTQAANCQLLARSPWHGTIPIGGAEGQGDFLNGALLLETSLPPAQLARTLQNIESKLGRQRVVRWDARTIDIDILLFGSEIIDSAELTIPHPRMGFRKFVLEPAVEIAGNMLHPTSGWTIAGLLAHIENSPRHVVVTAAQVDLARWLAGQLCQTMGCLEIGEEKKNLDSAGVLQPGGGIELPHNECGKPPAISIRSPDALTERRATDQCQESGNRPAVTIWLDVPNSDKFAKDTFGTGLESKPGDPDWKSRTKLEPEGLGPVARISSDDPATVIQEAQAALRCIWPDIP